jgi:two-component sensor histidine kinase
MNTSGTCRKFKNSAGSTDIISVINIKNFTLDVSQAVLIGLILNEAITNALKYAFP